MNEEQNNPNKQPENEPNPSTENQTQQIPSTQQANPYQTYGPPAYTISQPLPVEGDPSKDTVAIIGFIMGLVSLVCCGFILGIPGIVLSIKGLKSTKKSLSIAGLVLSIIGTAVTTIIIVYFIFISAFVANSMYN